MSPRYPIPIGRHRTEIIVLRSRFISTAEHTPTVESAKEFLADQRQEFPDASHHVHAFVVGYGASVTLGTSDDGEPVGTAGRPTLTVLQNAGVGDICVVTTRYFGGTKLGTGGLVKAYTESCQRVLEDLPTQEKVERLRARTRIPYSLYERFRRLLKAPDVTILQEEFEGDVTLHLEVVEELVESLAQQVADMTAGQGVFEVLDEH